MDLVPGQNVSNGRTQLESHLLVRTAGSMNVTRNSQRVSKQKSIVR